MNTVSNTPAFAGTSQFSVTCHKDDASSNTTSTPFWCIPANRYNGISDTAKPFGGVSKSENVLTGMGSSNIQFGGNGFGSTTATAPGFGGSARIPFGAPAQVFGGNTTLSATTDGFSLNASNTKQNTTFQFNPKP